MVEKHKVIINEIVRRVVAAVQPKKIVLFGSSARGEENSAGDIDLSESELWTKGAMLNN